MKFTITIYNIRPGRHVAYVCLHVRIVNFVLTYFICHPDKITKIMENILRLTLSPLYVHKSKILWCLTLYIYIYICVTVFWKTDRMVTNTEIHFMPVDECHTHALPRDTMHLRIVGRVCFYRRLFCDAVKPQGCISWPVWPLRGYLTWPVLKWAK